jgi:D-alanyl-D-alanine carboxypeptidase
MLALTGCTAGGATPTSSATATPTSTSSADASGCVPDPQAVIDRKPTTASTGKLPASLSRPLDAAASAAFTASGAPGAVVGVRSPKGTWVKAYGVANIATQAPMTTDMHHRIASVTKTFTGTLIMQLVQQKKISLDDPISKYVPNVPGGSQISLLELANMTSGIADYTDDTAFLKLFLSDYSIIWNTDQLLATAYAMPTTSAPGAESHYSNSNYLLLGQVIEKVTGHSLSEEFSTRIFKPLHLTGTSYDPESSILPNPHAHGYTSLAIVDGSPVFTGPLMDATVMNTSEGGAAGSIVSRVDDLLTYGRALGTGQGLLSAAAQTQRLTSFPGGAYGIGLICEDGWVGHTGGFPGYNTDLKYDTRTDTTVVVEINGDNMSGTPAMLPADRIYFATAAALGRPIVPPDVATDPGE